MSKENIFNIDGEKAKEELLKEATHERNETGVNVNFIDEEGVSLVHRAIWSGDIDAIKLLIDAGANVNFIDKEGTSELQLAIRNGSIEVIKLLIEKGANVNFIDKKGAPLLQYTIERENIEVIKLLIDAGANVNFIDEDGDSVLQLALRNETMQNGNIGNIEVIKLLIDAGANVNFINRYGEPLLSHVLWKGIEVIKLLIDAGANVNLTDICYSYQYSVEDKEKIKKMLKLGKVADAIAIGSDLPEDFDIKLLDKESSSSLITRVKKLWLNNGYHFYKKVLPEGVILSLLTAIDDLEEEFNEGLNKLEIAMIPYVTGITPTPYDIIIKSQNIIDIKQLCKQSDYTNILKFIESSEFKNSTSVKISEEEIAAIEFYENNPQYQEPGSILSAWIQSDNMIANMAYIMQHNIDVLRLVKQITKFSKLTLNDMVTNQLKAAIDLYNTHPEFDLGEEDGYDSLDGYTTTTTTVVDEEMKLSGDDAEASNS